MSHTVAKIRLGLPGMLLLLASPLWAQSAAETLFPAEERADQRSTPVEVLPLDDELAAQVQQWLEELGSKEFATRERAATRLAETGGAVIPRLRHLIRDSSDPEVRLRAEQIIKQLTRGDLETRIENFLAGEDVHFDGWRITQAIIGDSSAIRELFVELMRQHPNLAGSLDGTPRDRALAMGEVVAAVQNAMFVERKFPTRADAFALLLPSIDPNVPISAAYDSVLLSVLQKEAASKIRKDAQLSGPFASLLSRWIPRSSLANRDDVLLFGMAWDLEATLTLAIRTLGEANQTETLALALQTIARFGDKEHIALVRPLIDDSRPSSERGYTRGQLVRTQLGDVAMATIAVLHKVPLKEVGFTNAEVHPTYGFLLGDLGFPVDDEKPRKAARAKIEKLLADAPEPERS